jgi:hypothetical protein
MKTTIDLPDVLFREAKIHAAEQGITLKEIVVNAVQAYVNDSKAKPKKQNSYWQKPILLPEYRSLLERGTLRGGTDSSLALEEERHDA